MTRKTIFVEGWSWFSFNNLRQVLGMPLKFDSSLEKGLKLKVRKFVGITSISIDVTVEKLCPLSPSSRIALWLILTFLFKGALFLKTTESPLKMMKNAFYFTLKALFVLKILSFCLDFLIMYKNGLIRKIRLILKFMTSQPG